MPITDTTSSTSSIGSSYLTRWRSTSSHQSTSCASGHGIGGCVGHRSTSPLSLSHASLGNSATIMWMIGFIVCSALVLVPSPLIEPRYFLIPTILLRLQLPHTSSDTELWLEYAWYSLINTSALALFLLRKFRWEGWEGWMRFMW